MVYHQWMLMLQAWRQKCDTWYHYFVRRRLLFEQGANICCLYNSGRKQSSAFLEENPKYFSKWLLSHDTGVLCKQCSILHDECSILQRIQLPSKQGGMVERVMKTEVTLKKFRSITFNLSFSHLKETVDVWLCDLCKPSPGPWGDIPYALKCTVISHACAASEHAKRIYVLRFAGLLQYINKFVIYINKSVNDTSKQHKQQHEQHFTLQSAEACTSRAWFTGGEKLEPSCFSRQSWKTRVKEQN